jgi:hypothetical protein
VRGLPAQTVSRSLPIQGVDVFSLVREHATQKLKGPVDLRLDLLHCAYIVAWYCIDSAHAEVRIKDDIKGNFPVDKLLENHIEVVTDGTWSSIRFEEGDGRWTIMARIRELSSLLAQLKLTNGTRMEVCTASWDEAIGMLRFGGYIADGIWHIEETYPALEATVLREALSIAQQADEGGPVTIADTELGANTLAVFDADWSASFKDNMPKLEGNSYVLIKPDYKPMHSLLLLYICQAFGDSFPVEAI